MIHLRKTTVAVTPVYRRMCNFNMLVHLLVFLALHLCPTNIYVILLEVKKSEFLAHNIYAHGKRKPITLGKSMRANSGFTITIITCFLAVVFALWLSVILLCSGDVHPNPGPSSTSSSDSSFSSSSMSDTIFNSLTLHHNFTFVHYNVQSIGSKLGILHAELLQFDILAFTETWLDPTTDTHDLIIHSYNIPERRDRVGDAHGGVMIYVKEGIHYKRRDDLEIRGIECIWIEVANSRKHILFGLFYRPPNSLANYNSNIEDSLALALDTGIADIIVTGDFNLNVLNFPSARKIISLCQQFSLYQSIDQPTHFTENSTSLIDIILVSNRNNLILSGVGDPFLNQDIRYHCPIFGLYKFFKPKFKSFVRHIWRYDLGDYNLLRQKASTFDWESLQDDDINKYANSLNATINAIAGECIPNKQIRVKPFEPPWLTSSIKRHIRKRKRAFKKVKKTNLNEHWAIFKTLRNEGISMIRDSKNSFNEKLAEKLKSKSLTARDWWSTLKTFISPNIKSTIPPLEHENHIYTDEHDKENILNIFFQSQTLLDENNASLPDLVPSVVRSQLNSISFSPLEVESILKTLAVGKASGPNALSNRILREIASEISFPFCSLFNQSLRTGIVPTSYKEANVCPVPKTGDLFKVSKYRPISLLNSEAKLFEKLIFKYLFNHFRDNHLLSSLQSGFLPGDSTVNQLTYLYNTFSEALDSGKEVRAVFCDISKAFDRVWHAGVLHKLESNELFYQESLQTGFP